MLDTNLAGRVDAFNPAELLLAAVAVCMIRGIERVTPMLKFDLRGVEVGLHEIRQDGPPKIVSFNYVLTVDIDETGQRLSFSTKTSAATARSPTLLRRSRNSKA